MIHETYVEEDGVPIGISIVLIDSVESLGELNIADFPPNLRIHQEAHRLPYSLAVVDVVIAIQVEHEWSICQHS